MCWLNVLTECAGLTERNFCRFQIRDERYGRTHTCTHRSHIHTHITHTYTDHTHAHTDHTHKHAHTQQSLLELTHAQTHMHTHADTHTHVHTHSHTHMYTHMHPHPHTQTHIGSGQGTHSAMRDTFSSFTSRYSMSPCRRKSLKPHLPVNHAKHTHTDHTVKGGTCLRAGFRATQLHN